MSETKQEKWERGKTLFLESVYKPDDRLRGCAHNQECYHELMEIRDQVIEMVRAMPNPHTPPLEFGKKNSFVLLLLPRQQEKLVKLYTVVHLVPIMMTKESINYD